VAVEDGFDLLLQRSMTISTRCRLLPEVEGAAREPGQFEQPSKRMERP
jgi:hypothetical protein